MDLGHSTVSAMPAASITAAVVMFGPTLGIIGNGLGVRPMEAVASDAPYMVVFGAFMLSMAFLL